MKSKKKDIIDIPIFWDFDLTVSKEYQQLPLFEKRFKDIQKHLASVGIQTNHSLDYFKKVDLEGGDLGLVYLQHMIWDAQKGGCLEGLTNTELFSLGKLIQPADGFRECLVSLRKEFAGKARLHHFFISVGLLEMMKGFLEKQRLKTYVDQIAASQFFTDKKGVINGIKNAVLPFTKNEWIISFMKGSHGLLNRQLLPKQYKFSYPNMIVIGDGYTDISKFSYAKKKGGTPVAVYRPQDKKLYQKAAKTVGPWADYILPQEYGVDTLTYQYLVKIIQDKIDFKPALRHATLHDYKKGLVTDSEEKAFIQRVLKKDVACQKYFEKVFVDHEYNEITSCQYSYE